MTMKTTLVTTVSVTNDQRHRLSDEDVTEVE